jgi:type II secretory pathway pseudopilin PulG
MFFRNHKRKGFTLLEMILSIGIFTVVVITSISITLAISNAQLKAANIQAIQDNIRFSLELITKEMRTGTNYQLTSICAPPGSEISFLDSSEVPRVYFLDSFSKTIMRAKQTITPADCDGSSGKVASFTSEEINVASLLFDLRGAAPGPADGQPRVTISLGVLSKDAKLGTDTSMNLQTTVAQRFRDIVPP